MRQGRFVTFEGIDGSGKSTQAALAVEFFSRLLGESHVLRTREPGDWRNGERLRDLLLHGELSHPHAELYLFLADRCEHVRQLLEPALDKGHLLLCERYCDSTLAYQSWGRGLSRAWIESLFVASAFPCPDLTLWIDVPVESACERMRARGKADRIESGDIALLAAVRDGYAALADEYPQRIVRVDGDRSPRLVFEDVRSILCEKLKESGSVGL